MSSAAVIVMMKVTPRAITPMPVVVVPIVSVALISAMMVVIVLVRVALTALARPILLPGVTVRSTPELLHALLESSIELLQLLHLNLPHVVHLFKKKKKKIHKVNDKFNASGYILK